MTLLSAGEAPLGATTLAYYSLNTEQLHVNYKMTTVQLRMSYKKTTVILQMVTMVFDTNFTITFTMYLYYVNFFWPLPYFLKKAINIQRITNHAEALN